MEGEFKNSVFLGSWKGGGVTFTSWPSFLYGPNTLEGSVQCLSGLHSAPGISAAY